MTRCAWAEANDLYRRYHDEEWGVPCHDDHRLFEMLCLEGQQAGLSWNLILQKREGYREAFSGFDVDAVANFTEADIERLMTNPGVVRNRRKLQSVVDNARIVQELGRSLDDLLWSFSNHRVIDNPWQTLDQIPATTPESDQMAKDLRKLGFRFLGSTTCYALMQSCGIVNDHLASCFKRQVRRA